jgi:hypothetical protein
LPSVLVKLYLLILLDLQIQEGNLCPKTDESGLAVTLILNRGLELSLGINSCRCAFDYPAELQRHGISPEHWQRFTETICLETGLLRHQCTTVFGRDPDTPILFLITNGLISMLTWTFASRILM